MIEKIVSYRVAVAIAAVGGALFAVGSSFLVPSLSAQSVEGQSTQGQSTQGQSHKEAPLVVPESARKLVPETKKYSLSLEQKSVIRCSAAFAMVADAQERGDEKALKYPPLIERGQFFFVFSAVQLMDKTGYSREVVTQLIRQEAEDIHASGTIDDIMPPCLIMLEASGA